MELAYMMVSNTIAERRVGSNPTGGTKSHSVTAGLDSGGDPAHEPGRVPQARLPGDRLDRRLLPADRVVAGAVPGPAGRGPGRPAGQTTAAGHRLRRAAGRPGSG